MANEKREVKITFRKNENEIWEMVNSHSCKSAFIKDVLKWYCEQQNSQKKNFFKDTDFSGIL